MAQFGFEEWIMGISIGLVGLGKFGSSFADLFMAHPQVDRIGLCDREPDRISAIAGRESWSEFGKFNERDSYCDLNSICASDLDALVVMTQPWLHALRPWNRVSTFTARFRSSRCRRARRYSNGATDW